jgi:hypothetical protein
MWAEALKAGRTLPKTSRRRKGSGTMSTKRPRTVSERPGPPALVNVERRQEALRENLRRRKEQARARDVPPVGEGRKTLIRRDPA